MDIEGEDKNDDKSDYFSRDLEQAEKNEQKKGNQSDVEARECEDMADTDALEVIEDGRRDFFFLAKDECLDKGKFLI